MHKSHLINVKKQKKESNSAGKIFVLVLIAFIVIIVVARYATDEEYRSFIDSTVFRKQVSETNLPAIEINSDSNLSIYAYDKYVAVLSKNILKEYTADGKQIAQLEINVAVPLVETSDKYMVIAEKDGQKAYLISGNNIVWSNTIEGNISRVSVNKNGYVSMIITNTIYKSVIVYYEPTGKEVFRTYLSDSYAVCTAISTNNKFLAIGEVNYSGAVIKSYVRIVSVDLAQSKSKADEAIIYTYESENGAIITNIKYQDKDNAICMFSDYIQNVKTDSDERVYDISQDDLFLDINLKNGIAAIEKQSSGLFSFQYQVVIKNLENKRENLYILNSDLPKSISVSGNNIALNLGNEVQIVNSSGWLQKKYTSKKQIQGLVIGDSIAGIIYKNKIEIINL